MLAALDAAPHFNQLIELVKFIPAQAHRQAKFAQVALRTSLAQLWNGERD
jgi:hypothetical protein